MASRHLPLLPRGDVMRVAVLPDADPRYKHALTSSYVEWFWLPVIGSTSVCMLRRLVTLTMMGAEPLFVPLPLLSRMVGLGEHTDGVHAPVRRTLARLLDFHCAVLEDDVIRVRALLPDLSQRQLEQLPALITTLADRFASVPL